MALAVETTSTATSTSTSVVVTKPTGVAVGDLLLIIAPTARLSTVTSSGFTQAYLGEYDAPGSIADVAMFVLYKVADSSDVSASNYTVSYGSVTGSIAAMIRISGWTSGNPVYQSTEKGFTNNTDGTLTSTGLSLSRLSQQIHLMLMASYDDGDSDYYKDITNRSITSSDSNPTWTEVCNIGPITNSVNGLSALTLNVAYATTSLSSSESSSIPKIAIISCNCLYF